MMKNVTAIACSTIGILQISAPSVYAASGPHPFSLPPSFNSQTRLYHPEGQNTSIIDLTIVPEIQIQLEDYIKKRGNPIAGVMVSLVQTGQVLAFVQGKSPESWGTKFHTCLHPRFPNASLFKTVIASAAFESTTIRGKTPIGLRGGCLDIDPGGRWLSNNIQIKPTIMTLHKAYGLSCNSFFAKLAVNQLGLGPIIHMTKQFGWNRDYPIADFEVPDSPISIPDATKSSAYSIGKFAAGFGEVGTSIAFANWQTIAIGNDGIARNLRINQKSPPDVQQRKIISKETAEHLRDIMKASIRGGTASYAFRRSRYRKIRYSMGGKTGTLTGGNPQGLTTLFSGLYPIDHPTIAVTAITVISDRYHFKAPNLAAEAVLAFAKYEKHHRKKKLNLKNIPPMTPLRISTSSQ